MFLRLLPLLFLSALRLGAQTPDYWLHDPVTAGVNNTAFHGGICQQFLAIYGGAEWAAAGLSSPAPVPIDRIWFRSNMASAVTLSDLTIRMGQASSTTPVPAFNANFDVSGPDVVLSAASYTVNFLAGAWSDPTNAWTSIDLPAPFLYDPANELVAMVEFSASSFPIPVYAASPFPAPIHPVAGSATASGNTWRPMFGISLADDPPVAAFTASDDTLCAGACLNVSDASAGAPTAWTWSFAGGEPATASGPDAVACFDSPGTWTYTLVVANGAGTDTATGSVTVLSVPSVDLGPDTAVCAGDVLLLQASGLPAPQWSDGGTGPTREAADEGWYWVQAGGVCPVRDSLYLSVLPLPAPELGPPTLPLCTDSTLRLEVGGFLPSGTQLAWNTGAQGDGIVVGAPGTYTVTATAGGCTSQDAVNVLETPCGCSFTMPNAFTPDGDGRNDRFRPVFACAVEAYRLRVYNRWGGLVFEARDPALGWDGTLAGRPQEAGAYLWTLEATIRDRGRVGERWAQGSLTLLR
jgi:gliding motility-associated-like protein